MNFSSYFSDILRATKMVPHSRSQNTGEICLISASDLGEFRYAVYVAGAGPEPRLAGEYDYVAHILPDTDDGSASQPPSKGWLHCGIAVEHPDDDIPHEYVVTARIPYERAIAVNRRRIRAPDNRLDLPAPRHAVESTTDSETQTDSDSDRDRDRDNDESDQDLDVAIDESDTDDVESVEWNVDDPDEDHPPGAEDVLMPDTDDVDVSDDPDTVGSGLHDPDDGDGDGR